MGLVTLDDAKTYLGIDLADTSQDSFVQMQIDLFSEAIETYTQRSFEIKNWQQTFYGDLQKQRTKLTLARWPIISISSITEYGDSSDLIGTGVSMNDLVISKDNGFIFNPWGFNYAYKTVIVYTAGIPAVPLVIKSVILSLIQERYAKKQSGLDLNFGSNVARVSIPGTVSIDFDYQTNNDSRNTPFGNLLGDYLNMIDYFRAPSAVIGSNVIEYVEEQI